MPSGTGLPQPRIRNTDESLPFGGDGIAVAIRWLSVVLRRLQRQAAGQHPLRIVNLDRVGEQILGLVGADNVLLIQTALCRFRDRAALSSMMRRMRDRV